MSFRRKILRRNEKRGEDMPENETGTKARLVINLLSDGSIHVNGPLTEKILCLGMLKMAEQLVLEYKQKPQNLVQIPEIVGVEPRRN
jgi:hypothetical protein